VSRGRLIAAVLAALVVGVGAGLLVSLCSDDGPAATSASVSVPPATIPTTGTTPSAADEQTITRTVTNYVNAAATSDGGTLCGLEAEGATVTVTGAGAAEACAEAAGIDLAALPAPVDLRITAIRVTGDRASAALAGSGRFSLVRSSGGWQIDGYAPA
jgi:hypothetical protein